MYMQEMNKNMLIVKGVSIVFIGFYFLHISQNPLEWHFLDNVTLIFHEAGHVIFFFLGDFVQVAGGTIMQLVMPLTVTFYFYKRRQYFSAYVVLFWVGHSLINISVYAGDAVAMQLPLLGGDGVGHDWNYLLSHLNILQYTPIVSGVYFYLGIAVYFFAMSLGVYRVYLNERGEL